MSENQIGMNGLERELEERKVRALRRGHSVNSLITVMNFRIISIIA